MRWIVRDATTGLTWHHNAAVAPAEGAHAIPPCVFLGPAAGAHRFASREAAEAARDRWRAVEAYTSDERAAQIEVEEVG